jgi:hypothetical protein
VFASLWSGAGAVEESGSKAMKTVKAAETVAMKDTDLSLTGVGECSG